MKHICIIGGGAAGLMAAISAARQDQTVKITVIEKKERPGKKLLATGNGRCNLTNTHMDPSFFRSDSPDFIKPVLDQFGVEDTMNLFHSLGLMLKNREEYIYPRNDQAASVLNMLLQEAKRLGIHIVSSEIVTSMQKKSRQFEVITDKQKLFADKVILSTGGKASSKLGSDGSGYLLAKSFGHHIVDVCPALVQLRVKGNPLADASGVRCQALLSAFVDGEYLASDKGELQITQHGLSGIPAFQISRFISKGLLHRSDCMVRVDFLPEYKQKNCKKLLMNLFSIDEKRTIEEVLGGIFQAKLVTVLLKQAKISPKLYSYKLSDSDLDNLILSIKRMELPVFDTMGFDQAQVTAGGVDLTEIDKATMESRLCPGLYVTGELLDVDGICGGYNLQWAWSTGYLAGLNAARSFS